MRDVGEHRVAGAAHRLELRLVTDHLHLKSVDRSGAGDDRRARLGAALQPLDALRAAFGARFEDGASVIARAAAFLLQRLQHIAAEAADGLLRVDAQEPGGLGVEIADVAMLIDCVDALDDASEHRLRLSLTPSQRPRQLQKIAAHVLHGMGERADLGGAARRNRGGEIALSDAHRRVGERLDGTDDTPTQDRAGKHRDCGENQGGQNEIADQPGRRAFHQSDRQARIDEADGLAARCKERHARLVDSERVDPPHCGVPVGERRGIERRVRIHRIGGVRAVIEEADLGPDPIRQLVRKPRVEQPQHVDPDVPRTRHGHERPERGEPQVGRQRPGRSGPARRSPT